MKLRTIVSFIAVAGFGLGLAAAPALASDASPGAAQQPSPAAAPATNEQVDRSSGGAAAARFADVPANHWAYQALQQLQADGLIEGYPGGYFKGNRPLTRYEVAAITARVVKRLEGELAQPSTAQAVNPADVAALRRLLDEYGDQLKSVQKDVAVLKDQAAATASTLDRQQFHLYYSLRAPGTYSDRVTASTAAGAALPPGAQVVGPDNGVGPQQLGNGATAHGTGFQVLRMVFSGNLDPSFSYAMRLEDRYYLDNTNGNGGRLGDSTSSVTPGFGSFPNNGALRINYANVNYISPSGIYARLGRFIEESGSVRASVAERANDPEKYAMVNSQTGLAFADYFNGVEVGYEGRKHRLNAFAGYSFNKAANSNAAPYTGLSSQTLFGRIGTNLGTKLTLGANFVNDTAFYGGGPTVFNASTLRYQQAASNLAVGSIDAGYAMSPKLNLYAEYLHRFGNDPINGGAWTGPNAFELKGNIGASGSPGNTYLDFGYITAGANSTSVHTEVEGTPDYQQFYLNNPNGYNIGWLGVHHFFSKRAQIGLVYQTYGLHTVIPIDSYSFGVGAARIVTPCLGCVINRDDGRALFVDTRLAF